MGETITQGPAGEWLTTLMRLGGVAMTAGGGRLGPVALTAADILQGGRERAAQGKLAAGFPEGSEERRYAEIMARQRQLTPDVLWRMGGPKRERAETERERTEQSQAVRTYMGGAGYTPEAAETAAGATRAGLKPTLPALRDPLVVAREAASQKFWNDIETGELSPGVRIDPDDPQSIRLFMERAYRENRPEDAERLARMKGIRVEIAGEESQRRTLEQIPRWRAQLAEFERNPDIPETALQQVRTALDALEAKPDDRTLTAAVLRAFGWLTPATQRAKALQQRVERERALDEKQIQAAAQRGEVAQQRLVTALMGRLQAQLAQKQRALDGTADPIARADLGMEIEALNQRLEALWSRAATDLGPEEEPTGAPSGGGGRYRVDPSGAVRPY